MNIKWFLLTIVLCAFVSAHRLPGEQDTRATFLISDDQHQGAVGITVPAGTNNVTFLLQYTDTDLPVQKLDVVHERQLHIFVIGEDLSTFLHLHPEEIGAMDFKKGKYTLPLTLTHAGKYLVVVDFSVKGISQFHTLSLTVTEGPKIGAPDATLNDHYEQEYSSTLSHKSLLPNKESAFTFTLSQDGKLITDIEPYLGADIHVAIVSADFSHAGHTHPTIPGHFGAMSSMPQRFKGPTIPFSYTFPNAGKYVIFTQFQHRGDVHTARFVVEVQDPLMLPYIWFSAGALVVAGLAFMYMIRKRVGSRLN